MVFQAEAEELFQRGILALQQKNSLAALAFFERSYALRKTPLAASYLGFCMAAERGVISDALSLCNQAIEQEPHEPRHYLNLAKVYLKADLKPECLNALRKGIAQGDDPQIRLLLETVGVRKTPLFSFLPRGSFLNKYLGIILKRIRLR